MQEIDVEKIMEEIRAEIKEKGYTEEILKFDDVTLYEPIGDRDDLKNDFSTAIAQLRNVAFIPWHRPVPIGIKGLIKKVIRKCTGFIIAPITEDQTNYNQTVINVFEKMEAFIQIQNAEIEKQEKIIEMLRKRL